jgi:hypothetical protein
MRRYAIALVAAVLCASGAAAQQGSLGMATPRNTDAPLQIVGTVFGDTMLMLLLVNTSGRTIEQATISVVLGDQASKATPVVRVGKVCVATVPPDGLLVVTAMNTGFDTAAAYYKEKGIVDKAATVGLTHARFTDGAEWSYPLAAKGRFEEKKDEAVWEKAVAVKQKYFPDRDMSWAFSDEPDPDKKFLTCRK